MELQIDHQLEVDDFLQAQRPNWPNSPTPCPVFACGDHPYSSFSSFRRHWSQKHEQTIIQYACITCKQLFYRLDAYTRHQRKVHKVPNPLREGAEVPNVEYVQPGGVLPFKADMREKVAEKRKSTTTPGEVLVSTEETVCRDEEFDLERHKKISGYSLVPRQPRFEY